jgi:hypothetical protein
MLRFEVTKSIGMRPAGDASGGGMRPPEETIFLVSLPSDVNTVERGGPDCHRVVHHLTRASHILFGRHFFLRYANIGVCWRVVDLKCVSAEI